MPVTNVALKAVEARRYQDAAGKVQIRIDHNSHLANVQRVGEALHVEFQFTTSYGALGVVKAEGMLAWTGGDLDGALAQWNEKRNLPPEVAQQVHQGILAACVPEAVGLSRTVRLPPPIPMPQVRVGQQDAKAGQEMAPAAPTDSPEIG